MAKRRVFRNDKSRTPLLATTFVIVGGIVACLAISMPFSDQMTGPLLITAAALIGLSLVLGWLRKPTQQLAAELYAIAWAKPPKTIRYHLKRMPPAEQTEPRQPPTAETIRQIRGK